MNNKECINVFTVLFSFSGKVDIFNRYKDVILNIGTKNYYFECDVLKQKLNPNTSLNQAYEFVYNVLFTVTYSAYKI